MKNQQVWYSPDTNSSSPDAIHQILMYGSLKDTTSFIKKMGQDKVKQAFLKFPKKIYTNSAFNFIKKFLLNINTPLIDEQKYLKSSPRNIR